MATFHIKEELIVILRSLADQQDISHRIQLTEMLELTHRNQENQYIALLSEIFLLSTFFYLCIAILRHHFCSFLMLERTCLLKLVRDRSVFRH
jgi:hypothetical protein